MIHDFSIVFDTENELWQRVLNIYAKNENYEKKVVKNRNLHHKFPRSFSKALGEEVDNDKDNLISLSLAEHFLVHYYYYKLAKKGYRQSMATAFTFMARKSIKYITPDTAEAIAKDYEEACKNSSMKGKHHTEESKRNISKAHKGMCHSSETRKKISESMKGHDVTENTKRRLSEANRGTKNPMFRKFKWKDDKGNHVIDFPENIADGDLTEYRKILHYIWNDISEDNKRDWRERLEAIRIILEKMEKLNK